MFGLFSNNFTIEYELRDNSKITRRYSKKTELRSVLINDINELYYNNTQSEYILVSLLQMLNITIDGKVSNYDAIYNHSIKKYNNIIVSKSELVNVTNFCYNTVQIICPITLETIITPYILNCCNIACELDAIIRFGKCIYHTDKVLF